MDFKVEARREFKSALASVSGTGWNEPTRQNLEDLLVSPTTHSNLKLTYLVVSSNPDFRRPLLPSLSKKKTSIDLRTTCLTPLPRRSSQQSDSKSSHSPRTFRSPWNRTHHRRGPKTLPRSYQTGHGYPTKRSPEFLRSTRLGSHRCANVSSRCSPITARRGDQDLECEEISRR